ncbi:3-oxo-tetronate 4-phosphate decarboxylase [Rhodococcus sp. ACPA1]|uniref:3-oxo-tetronate 4-phosphate decarboxylase n=1 Tax=Rhodococcus sp. ACPA1 TaxID=2028572 RepID=UPI000BB11404|nr:3-oxo-tetronate 4-phosphate decarboxylase [Rhodococcus sp. ACPA1]PBC51784.1 aldolase [Rhodococcus sp. ACPA1]
MTHFEDERAQVIAAARSIFTRSLTHGSTGNISVRAGENILVTPTGSSLGTVEPDELSIIDAAGKHLGGTRPSKEAFLHAAILRARPQSNAVVHTHSTYAGAVSCLVDIDPADVLPPLTAYFAMRVGKLPLLPYYAPGDDGLEETAEHAAITHHALLLSNHGPIVAGDTVVSALDAIEELEETSKLFLLLRGMNTRPLTTQQRDALASTR